MSASKLGLSAVALTALVACSSEVPVGSRDGGPPVDAAAPDTGPIDAGTTLDAGADGATDVDAARQCTTSAACGAGSYCHTPYGMCGGAGVCETFDPTVVCDVVPAPVCGCDGHTYLNECAARRAGISGDHLDSCPPVTGDCFSDLDCDSRSFCETPMGSCGGNGTCTDRGIGRLCSTRCMPECGCDGTSYQNDCQRLLAGVSLMQDGVCPGGTPPCAMDGACCTTTADGVVGQECAPTGGGPMKCMPIPGAPDCWLDADCPPGQTCTDPYICPCGSSCPRPDTLGACM